MLVSDYPEFKEHLENHVLNYIDPKKVWYLEQLRKVPFLKDADPKLLQIVLYSMTQRLYEKNDTINRKSGYQ